jgi:coenzyme F420-0:L-glutamate ligase/coenzyme F420-1:gamma-L-glutamate ligase
VRAVSDEVAALADLVKGKLEGRPAALVRGLGDLVTADDGPGAAALLREGDADWFRFGHVEAVRAALGLPPGTDGVAPVPLIPGDAAERLRRAVDVALAAPMWPVAVEVSVSPDADRDGAHADVVVPAGADPGTLLALGALVQRIAALSASEGLSVSVDPYPSGAPCLTVRTHLPD